MERFYNKDGSDDSDDQEPFFGENGENSEDDEPERIGFIDQQSIIDVMHMDLAQAELNQQLLHKAMEIAKQSWFWYFKSAETRLKDIEDIYQRLLKLTDTSEKET